MWTFPGGKIEYGEPTLKAAVRELNEEILCNLPNGWKDLEWYETAFCSTDSIHPGYHYLIAQTFASAGIQTVLPETRPADDAKDAQWCLIETVRGKCVADESPIGVLEVILRAEDMLQKGLFDKLIKL
jgi:8-oxo-dGTP pyrophosphatase MutT (NUDIX family)